MRELKFRISYNLNNQPLPTGRGLTFHVEHTLQQYTGLKDKNGKEIYEGDIVDFGENQVKKAVAWSSSCGAFIFPPVDGINGDTEEEKDFIYYQHELKNAMVIE